MLQIARLAPNLLGDSAPLVADFYRSQQQPDGGYSNRAGDSDLYYTVFAIDGLIALRQDLPVEPLSRYVSSFAEVLELDLVHAACLARCWSALPSALRSESSREKLLSRIAEFRTEDGGFDPKQRAENGSLYGAFMAVGAYQDLGASISDPDRLLESIGQLRDPRGAFWQSSELPVSLVPATAGAITLLRHLGNHQIDPALGDWLLACFDNQGGFRSAPEAPMPDLLSTATALHALSSLKIDLGDRKEDCLDFVDTLWTNRGGFYGHWEDTHVDCEYTYYGLLALGHLSL